MMQDDQNMKMRIIKQWEKDTTDVDPLVGKYDTQLNSKIPH